MSEIDLSVILITASNYERIGKTIRHLAAQEVADRMQLIVVCQDEAGLEMVPEDLQDFGEVTVFPAGPFDSTGNPRADAVAVAKGAVTVFAEDHCFPELGWAQALLAAHAAGYPAVGPTMSNANPDTALSWADMCLNFGPSVDRDQSEESSLLCWHNMSYSTELLLEQEDLGVLLEAEGVLFAGSKIKVESCFERLTPRSCTPISAFCEDSSWDSSGAPGFSGQPCRHLKAGPGPNDFSLRPPPR